MVNLGVTISNASKVNISDKFILYGDNTYTLSTNSISWGDANYLSISDLVFSVGKYDNSGVIQCGNTFISPYDFGLLYCTFCVMVWASKSSILVTPEVIDDSTNDYKSIWIDSQLIVYNNNNNNIICISSSDIFKVLNGNKVRVKCFTTTNEYTLSKHDNGFILDSTDGILIKHILPSTHLKNTYPKYFSVSKRISKTASISSNSQLGLMLNELNDNEKCSNVLQRYIDSGVETYKDSRIDLIFTPSKKYESLNEFCGSRAYSDTGDIVLPVNWHNGLLVYIPWFSDCGLEETGCIEARISAVLPEFYNITDECNAITSYAITVPTPPADSFCYPTEVLLAIKESFMTHLLPRVSIAGAIGKSVIPESVIVSALITNDNPYELYSIMPVGVIGTKIIIKTSLDKLVVSPYGFDLNECYYDISEVI